MEDAKLYKNLSMFVLVLALVSCEMPQQSQVSAADQTNMSRLVGAWSNGNSMFHYVMQMAGTKIVVNRVYDQDIGHDALKGDTQWEMNLFISGRRITGVVNIISLPKVEGFVDESFNRIVLDIVPGSSQYADDLIKGGTSHYELRRMEN